MDDREPALLGFRLEWGGVVVAKSARDRKQTYDAIMRNRGRALRPDDVERYPTMLYLSDGARKVLREQRQLDRYIGAAPCTDSKFVEAAILAKEGQAPAAPTSDPERIVMLARQRALTERKKLDLEATRRTAVEMEVESLQRQFARAREGEAIPFDQKFLRLHQAIRKEVLGSMTQLEEAKGIHRLLCEWLMSR